MGMFDYIKSEMPLPGDPRPDVEWFQTKDVPTDQLYLEKWIIRSDGRLVKLGVRYEDHSDKTLPEDDIMRLAGMMTPILDPSLDRTFDDFHGDLEFGHYDTKSGEDWDYTARFTDGKCTKIGVEYTPPSPALSRGHRT
jgi:hypothetical protein